MNGGTLQAYLTKGVSLPDDLSNFSTDVSPVKTWLDANANDGTAEITYV